MTAQLFEDLEAEGEPLPEGHRRSLLDFQGSIGVHRRQRVLELCEPVDVVASTEELGGGANGGDGLGGDVSARLLHQKPAFDPGDPPVSILGGPEPTRGGPQPHPLLDGVPGRGESEEGQLMQLITGELKVVGQRSDPQAELPISVGLRQKIASCPAASRTPAPMMASPTLPSRFPAIPSASSTE